MVEQAAASRPPLGPSEEHRFAVQGMTCASCVGRVERALRALPGVSEAAVNLLTEVAAIKASSVVSSAALKAAIQDAGYEADVILVQRAALAPVALPSRWGWPAVLAVLCTVPLLLGTMVPMAVPAWHMRFGGLMHWMMGWGGLLFAAPVQFLAGAHLYRQAWAEVRHRSLGMSSLVMLGSSAAFFYSLFALLAPSWFPEGQAHSYFEASSSVIMLVLVGKELEARAKGQSSEAITKLLGLRSATARVRTAAGDVDVAIDSLKPGDLLLVRPGERIAADGEVVTGRSFVDEAMISGEPMAVSKAPGDTLVGGTLNTSGALEMRVTRVGADSVLEQIVRTVQEAQASKPQIQAFADRVAAVFVPVVMAVAACSFTVWWVWGPAPAFSNAWVAAVTVLVVACPCAMGLATPTAMMVASGKAAELGLVVRKATALEQLAAVTVVVFDKTGTLTEGKPQVVDSVYFAPFSDSVLPSVAALEALSEHPLAAAIVRHAAATRTAASPAPAEALEVRAGLGISAHLAGQSFHIGSEAFLCERSIVMSPSEDFAKARAARGDSLVFVSVDGRLAAAFAVADAPKEGSAPAVAALQARGLRVLMLSGDNARSAGAMASRLGISEVRAGVLPVEKAREIEALQASGQKVAFVGDGLNDAPALARAQVGIALGTGTDVAIEAGDLLLMGGDVRAVVTAFELARATMRTIRRNFLWAYGYNVALIPVAAGVFFPWWGWRMSPILSAAAMSASSLFVLGSSLALKRFQAPRS